MARRHAQDSGGCLVLLVIFAAAVGVLQWIGAHIYIIYSIITVVIAIYLLRFLIRVMQIIWVRSRVHVITAQQLDALIRRRMQLVQNDAYGKPRTDRWLKELDYFLGQYVLPSLSRIQKKILHEQHDALLRLIDAKVVAASESKRLALEFSDHFTPSEFETYCAEVLRRRGWNARVTQQSRDQGVDIIATKSGLRIVLQCKLYSNPVGNKAVQEAAAGRAHEQAEVGIVVTNSSYTAPAEALAHTNKVLLLHYSELADLDSILSRQWYS